MSYHAESLVERRILSYRPHQIIKTTLSESDCRLPLPCCCIQFFLFIINFTVVYVHFFPLQGRRVHITYYYTSDSLWKIWLVESIQSIHNSSWTWHDKCNICCRYCIYHVKFNVFPVTKPLRVFSSETEWLNASLLFLRMNYCRLRIFLF